MVKQEIFSKIKKSENLLNRFENEIGHGFKNLNKEK